MVEIIGGGPSGNTFARLMASKGHSVNLYEEHEKIGEPEACTGLFSYKALEYVNIPRKLVLNKINSAKIFSPSGKVLKIPLSKPDVVFNRSGFDKHLGDLAAKKGANLLTGYKFLGVTNKKIELRDVKTKKRKVIAADTLVGSDGPRSLVSKEAKIWNKYNDQILFGVQAVVKKKDIDESILFYPHLGEYSWEVPIGNNLVKLGVAARKNAKKIFDDLHKKSGGKIVEMQGGLIPLFHPKIRVQNTRMKPNVYLLGDAARQIKNTTGGGILAGIRSAEILQQCLTDGFDYQTEYKKSVRKEMLMHYYTNKVFQSFKKKDWESLIETCSREKPKKIISEQSRDNLRDWVLKLGISEPRFIKYIPKALKGLFD